MRFNPNLYANGKVCLSILGTWAGPSWAPIHTLGSILLSIQSLMNDKPMHNEPGYENSTNLNDVKNYNNCIKHETIRIGVIEMLNGSDMSKALPEALADVIKGLFVSFYDGYVITCQQQLQLLQPQMANNNSAADDSNSAETKATAPKESIKMIDPFGDRRGVFRYDELLVRLEKLNKQLDEDYVETEEDEATRKAMEDCAKLSNENI